MLNRSQVKEILLNTFAPENVGQGGYKSDLAYKLCNDDIGLKDLISAGYDEIVVEAFNEAQRLALGWKDFPEL